MPVLYHRRSNRRRTIFTSIRISIMGDCTIYLLLESSLLSKVDDDAIRNDELHLMPSSHVLSADSTLAEITSLLSEMLPVNDEIHSDAAASFLDHVCVVDASYHPAKSVTKIICDYPDKSGPRSKTLQSMGWFPSGKLVILSSMSTSEKKKGEEDLLKKYIEWQSRHVLNEEEFGYNLPSAAVHDESAKTGVQWTGASTEHDVPGAKLKPTDIFNAVQSRFDNEQPSSQQKSKQEVQAQKKKQKRTEQQRHQRLDSILNNLKSKKKTSITVRNMLIKSRAVGDKKLRMDDRFHLEIVRVDDSNDTTDQITRGPGKMSEYRFYSRQTTAGKVASGLAPSLGLDRAAEFLVCVSNEGEMKYRRLPNTTTLHDAQLKGWLNEFDLVLVRTYKLSSDSSDIDGSFGPSRSVLDHDTDNDSIDDANKDAMQVDPTNAIHDVIQQKDLTAAPIDCQVNANSDELHLQHRINTIFHMAKSGEIRIENNKNTTKCKQKKAVSKQVQNMLIKAKAKGNVKVKQEDRVYLEIIVFYDSNGDDVSVSSTLASFRFFDKRKNIGHILESLDVAKPSGGKSSMVEFIVHDDKNAISKLSADAIIAEAIKDGVLKNFNCVVVRVCCR